MSLRVHTQGGGAGGAFASIFVTGLSEADTVTATKDGKTVQSKWVQKQNPLVSVPYGYTQLSHIESTGTQHINTDAIGKNGTEIIADLQLANANNCYLFGYAGGNANRLAVFYWNLKYGFDFGSADSVYTSVSGTERHTFSIKDGLLNIDGVATETSSSQTYNTPQPIFVFARSIETGVATSNASMKLFSMQIKDNEVLIRNYVPAKRNSDGAVGLYDLVEGKFYGNNGTGEFIAGAEIPSTVDNHLISEIKEYGMWTVTATNGEETVTQDVLVDAAVEYEIEMGYYPAGALYWNGKEFEDITGGWYKNTNATIYDTSSANGAVEFQDDNIFIVSTNYNAVCVTTNHKISFANYTKFKFVITGETQDGAAMVGPTMLFATSANSGAITTGYALATYADADGVVKEVDISNLNDSYYISYATNGVRSGHLNRLWLE